ncbi:MAG: hypothetical protein CSB13_01735 [Chloroflexi bacterium]|nr:MAG: hypothetical protein CSB13_01735 [Chloroflexota bacterium]
MADKQVYSSGQNGALWILPNGPNTKPSYLPCYDLEDIAQSKGSITLIQCINERGEYETLGATRAAPEPTTTSLGTYLGPVADWMETVNCPFGLYVMLSCGQRGVFENWDRAMLLQVKAVTNHNISGVVRREEDVPAMHTFDIEAAPGITHYFRLTSAEQPIDTAITGNILSMRFSDDVACWDSCGGGAALCDYGIATTAGTASASGQVLLSPSLGNTAEWVPTAAAPFDVNEDVADAIFLKVGRDTNMIIAARGTTDASAPAEIARSLDNGATWTTVNVGSTNGEYFVKKGALFALNAYEIYAVSSGGRIYKSEDKGVTWEVREDATITTDPYHAIAMANSRVGYAVGSSGLVVKTLDGGKTWGQTGSAAGSDALYSVSTLSRNRVWVGSTQGVIYETINGGVTWKSRQLFGNTSPVNDMAWLDDYTAYAANGATVQFTINGGFSWEKIDDTTNLLGADASSINACSTRLVYSAAGNNIVQSAL